MTVSELIEELEKFPKNMTVVCHTTEEHREPSIMIARYNFNSSYWDGREFITLPKDTEFLEL